jgi:hypothetical protein
MAQEEVGSIAVDRDPVVRKAGAGTDGQGRCRWHAGVVGRDMGARAPR